MDSNTWGWIVGGTVLAGGAVVVGVKLAQKRQAAPTYFTVPVTESTTPAATTPAQPANSQSIPLYRYTVQSGDTLSGIAAADGTTVAVLAQLNHLSDVNTIDAGQILLLPHPLSSQKRAATQRSSSSTSSGSSIAASAPGPGVDGRVRRTAPEGSGMPTGTCAEYPLLCERS